MKANSYKDIPSGTRFGRFVVKEFSGFNYRRNAMFKCICDCGTVKNIPGTLLKSGDVKSCGCLPRDRMRGMVYSHIPDETGKRYGKLTVLRTIGEHSEKGMRYECECDCGEITTVLGKYLRNGSRASCTKWSCKYDLEGILNEQQGPEFVAKNAYFSGHFDGEGCISFQRDPFGDFPGLTVRVSAVYKPVILEYQEYFGGVVKPVNVRERMGRQQWQWGLMSVPLVLRFVKRVVPYSKEKKDQLELALNYLLERIKSGKYMADPAVKATVPALAKRMSELKRFEFKN